MALRPQGVTLGELDLAPTNHLTTLITNLRDQRGWDIRGFPMRPDDPRFPPAKRSGRYPQVYKVVGKMKWDGTYRSFIDPNSAKKKV